MSITYLTVIDRIKDEIRRPNLGPQIKLAIQSAIKHYEGVQFFFNEARAQCTTVRGQAYYELPVDFVYVAGQEPLQITVSGRVMDLELVPWDYLQQVDSEASTGVPDQWSYFEEQFRLYPIPNSEYDLTLAYVKTLTELNLDTDSNAWLTEAEELIRHRAKADLYYNVIHDYEKGDQMARIVTLAEDRLHKMSNRKAVTGRITPNYL